MASSFSVLLGIAVLYFANVAESAGGSWSYEGDTGPDHWQGLDTTGAWTCDGSSQSPINVMDSGVTMAEFDPWSHEGYGAATLSGTNIENNGHTAQINVDGDFYTSGGGLPYKYKVLQFHFHWGEENDVGSEHLRNSGAYPMEMHIVHWNSEVYGDVVPDAVEQPQGLAVLGVWIEVGEENEAFEPIIEALENVQYKGDIYDLTEQIESLEGLLPKNTDRFYRYSGSLTTPGCYESVVWTLFDETVELSLEQIEKFRALSHNVAPTDPPAANYTSKPIGFNYRPVQSLGSRTVSASFDPSIDATMPPSTTGGSVRNLPSVLALFVMSVLYMLLRSC